MPNLSDFPTDNTSTTNLKYDIITSKFLTGVHNHQTQSTPATSLTVVFALVGAVIQIIISLVMMIFAGLQWICKKE